MTRINLIDPSLLCDKHLMAEYRELIRIPNAVASGKMKPFYPDSPFGYTLGEGHVKFFVNKMKFLYNRHQDLYRELVEVRGFDVDYMEWEPVKIDKLLEFGVWNTHTPTEQEVNLNISRILDRMPKNPRWTNRQEPDYYLQHLIEKGTV